jgi:twitching motility protein PilT
MPCIREGIARIPAVEVMLANPSVRKLIADGREADLPQVIRTAQREGMVDLTDSLVRLVQEEWVDPKDAYAVAPNIEELKMAIKGIRTSTGGIL